MKLQGLKPGLRAARSTASLVILALILISILGVASYGAYKAIPQFHTEVHSILHHSATTSSTNLQSTFTISQTPTGPLATKTFYATSVLKTQTVSTLTESSSSNSEQVSTSTTFVSSQQTTNTTTSATKNWEFVVTDNPDVYVSGGTAYLNVTYSNVLGANASVYEKITLAGPDGNKTVGSPLIHVASSGQIDLNLQLGSGLTPGQYSVSFYLVDDASGLQVSATENVLFTVS